MDAAKTAMEDFKEAAAEAMKNRVEDGLEMVPVLEAIMDAIKTGVAFLIGLLGWLWVTLVQRVEDAREALEDGLDTARQISAPYIETGWEKSGYVIYAGVDMGKNAADSVAEYSTMAKGVGKEAFGFAVEYSGPFIESGRHTVEEVIEMGTAFYEEKNTSGALMDLIMAISSILITIILVGWFAVFLLSRGDLYRPVVEERGAEDQT